MERPDILTCTQQEAFDYVWTKLIEQGAPSALTDKFGFVSCKYRDPKGNRCAIGHLIADEDYISDWEGTGPIPVVKHIALHRGVDFKDVPHLEINPVNESLSAAFYTELQRCHDLAARTFVVKGKEAYLKALKENMKRLASSYDLSTKVMEKVE